MIKQFFVTFWIFLAISAPSEIAFGQDSQRAAEAHKLYVGSFGETLDAVRLRDKLRVKLSRTPTIILVETSASADAILKGTGTLRLVGRYHSNPRIRYSINGDVPVYDAKMTVVLEDSHGHPIWSGNLKPGFWGSQYVCDNVVNQAARHVSDALR